jgi:tetratricopeptide (TPR) repeat protein/nucleoside phosphorylase
VRENLADPTFGIVTALPEEFVAMRAMIDDASRRYDTDDRADYVLGTVPSVDPAIPHQVVLTMLGETGNDAAAGACANLVRSFRSVRCVLMVGIAAGVPNLRQPDRHVRLGDIVVATRGIVEYDSVRDHADGPMPRRTFPAASSLLERRANMLQANEALGLRPWETLLVSMVQHLPTFGRPSQSSDVLYSSDLSQDQIPHPDPALTGHRPGWPKVHYGWIGSGDRSLRSASKRDQIAAEYDVSAIEMEGKGIGNTGFSVGVEWFVIRGISDYGDSHANREWRKYASLAAASYTRALLAECPPIASQQQRHPASAGRSAGLSIPAQLPLDINGFTGRHAALSRLDLLVHDDADDRPHAVLITAIQGMPGIGKTSLAVHWAHRVAHRFPDGQLFLDLGGHSYQGAVTVLDALGHMLRGLGVDGTQIPADEEGRAAVYRSAIAGRRVLIVLDNAASAEQVRPLIPGSSSCLVVVTSRNRLIGLVAHDGARTIDLDVLSADEAEELITTVLGADRVSAETDALASLARLCAYLPLALRVAAADLAARRHDSIASAVRELSTDRLGTLTIDDDPHNAVQAAFELSFQRLSNDAKVAFRRLGLVEGPDFTTDAVAAILDLPTDAARRLLRSLERANLIEGNRPSRYRLHDLLREYARILTTTEDSETDRSDAVRRLLTWYLDRSRAAGRILHPHRRSLGELPPTAQAHATMSYSDALLWFENERANLIDAIRHAERSGYNEFTWELADALYDFLDLRSYHADNIAIHQTGLAIATHHSNMQACAYMLQHLALIETHRGRYTDAIDHAVGALAHFREISDTYAESAPLNALARIYLRLGRYPEALQAGHEALRIRQEIGDRRGEAETLGNLAGLSWRLCRYSDALREGHRALAIWQEIGDRRGEGEALSNIATIQASVGDSTKALNAATSALDISRIIGDDYGIANALAVLSNTYRRLARYPEALDRAEQALEIRRQISDLHGEASILVNQGKIYTESGRHADALRCLQQALKIQRDIGDRQGEGETLCENGYAYWRRGRYPQALNRLRQALRIQRDIGDRSGEGQTLDIMSRVYRRKGDYARALRLAEASLHIRRETGDRNGEAEVLGGIARIQRRQGDYATALRNARAALEIYSEVGFRRGEAVTLDNIARITRHLDGAASALPYAQESLAICREVGHPYDESAARDGLARILLDIGDTTSALEQATAAVAIEGDIGNLYGAGQTSYLLCLIYEQLGRFRDALDFGTQAAQLCRDIGELQGETEILATITRISAADGRAPEA